VLERVRALPEIQAVGEVNALFELGGVRNLGLRAIEGRPPEPSDQWTPLTWSSIRGEYFQAMGTLLLRGRYFTAQDGPNSPLVAIIDESMARRSWPGQDPISKRGDCRTLYIRQKAKRGKIQPNLKTKHAERDIDLCTPLAAMLRDFIGSRTSGLLFCTSTGKQLLQSNTLQDSLHPILKTIEHEKGGFNIFRRFRITELETAECPKALQHFWSGHAPTHVSERYKKLLKQRDWRLEWAERIGMGFELPARRVAPYASVIVFPKAG
jgi:hypothetical protein